MDCLEADGSGVVGHSHYSSDLDPGKSIGLGLRSQYTSNALWLEIL